MHHHVLSPSGIASGVTIYCSFARFHFFILHCFITFCTIHTVYISYIYYAKRSINNFINFFRTMRPNMKRNMARVLFQHGTFQPFHSFTFLTLYEIAMACECVFLCNDSNSFHIFMVFFLEAPKTKLILVGAKTRKNQLWKIKDEEIKGKNMLPIILLLGIFFWGVLTGVKYWYYKKLKINYTHKLDEKTLDELRRPPKEVLERVI